MLSVRLHDASKDQLRLHIPWRPATTRFQVGAQRVPAPRFLPGCWSGLTNNPSCACLEQETRFTNAWTLEEFVRRGRPACSLDHRLPTVGVLVIVSNQVGAYDRIDLEFAQMVALRLRWRWRRSVSAATGARAATDTRLLLEVIYADLESQPA